MPTELKLASFRDGAEVALTLPAPGRSGTGRPLLFDGVEAVVLRRTVPSGADPQQLLERLAVASRVRSTAACRPLAGSVEGDQVVVAFESPRGASLRTVLRLVPLTLDQAAMLGEGLLSALAALHRLGVAHGRVDADHAVLGLDGAIRLTEPGLWGLSSALTFSSDLEGAGRLLSGALAAVTSGAVEASGSGVTEQLASIANSLGSTPGGAGRARGALARWRRAAGIDPSQWRRVRRQLAALGASLPAAAAPAPRPASTPGATAPFPAADRGREVVSSPVAKPAVGPGAPSSTFPSARPAAGPTSPRGWRHAAVALVAALVLLVAGTAYLALLGTPGTTAPHSAGDHASSRTPGGGSVPATPPPSASAPGPQELPLLGPPSSPPIQQVQLTASCAATGSACQFNVTAQLGSHPAGIVEWKLDEVDRCTGAVTTVATGSIPAPGYYTWVEAQPQVSLPPGVPVALVALAGSPAMAASPPLSAGPAASSCPS